MELVTASIFGILFGFVLQRIGAADPDRIIAMLQLRDLTLMKTILAAIGFSSTLLFIGLAAGWIPADHLSVKPMYAGVTIGGMILGLGWSISGFCPGTSMAALGTGRKDAVFFFLGGLVGAGLYMVMYASLKDSSLMQPLFGGAVTLAANVKTASLFPEASGALVAAVVGIGLIAIATLLPVSLRK
jgi:uncharacterized membrane protein YedE/YeeE